MQCGAMARNLRRDNRNLLCQPSSSTTARSIPLTRRGRAVIPALTDAHVHLVWHGLARREIRLEGVDDLDVALQRVAAGAAGLPEGAWALGGGWDHSLWDGRWPTAAALDA